MHLDTRYVWYVCRYVCTYICRYAPEWLFTIVHIKSHDDMRSVFVHVCIGIMLHLSGYDCVLCLWLSVFALQVPLTINSRFLSVEMLRCSKLPLPPPPSPSPCSVPMVVLGIIINIGQRSCLCWAVDCFPATDWRVLRQWAQCCLFGGGMPYLCPTSVVSHLSRSALLCYGGAVT